MEVFCKLCKERRKIEECWCCIDGPSRHYECKESIECQSIQQRIEDEERERYKKEQELKEKQMKERKEQKETEEQMKQRVLEMQQTKEEEEIREAEELESAEIIEWKTMYKVGFFNNIVAYFIKPKGYTKVKTH